MSYTLEDILNALGSQHQYQHPHPHHHPHQRRYPQQHPHQPTHGHHYSRPQLIHQPLVFTPHRNIYAGAVDNDDNSSNEGPGEDYEPRYPAYYGFHDSQGPFGYRPVVYRHAPSPPPVPAETWVRPSDPQLRAILESINALTNDQSADEDEPVPEQENRASDANETDYPAVQPKANDGASKDKKGGQEQEAKVAEGAKGSDDASKSSVNAEKETSKVTSKETRKASEAEASSSHSASAKTHSKSKQAHSTTHFPEPRPKIELSQKNFNPDIPCSPDTNIYECNESYDIVLAIPGASIQNLDIDFHPSTYELVIKGSIPETASTLTNTLNPGSISKATEIKFGPIERRMKFPNLPKIVDEKIKAKYFNGLLSVKLPKNLESEKLKTKRKVVIEEVPDEELIWEEKGGVV